MRELGLYEGRMSIHYLSATPEIIQSWKEHSTSNASDFVRFEDNYFSVFALVDHRPVGLIVAKTRFLDEPLDRFKEVFIDIIEVHPDFQRLGIGTTLLNKVIQWAKENQADQIRAWSERIRLEALLMWKKSGFTFSRVDFQQGDEKCYGFYVAKRISS
jgi:GNAT superfamily N-acetyltransferase